MQKILNKFKYFASDKTLVMDLKLKSRKRTPSTLSRKPYYLHCYYCYHCQNVDYRR